MTTDQINPRFIEKLTGKDRNDIPHFPTTQDLTGVHILDVLKNISKLKTSPPHKQKLECNDCGHTHTYDIGQIVVNVTEGEKPGEKDFQLTGYFRCVKCNKADSWKIPNDLYMLAITALLAPDSLSDRCIIGTNQLFDGSVFQFPGESEEHLLDLIEQDPKNAFLWNRLGNLFRSGGRYELATAAYEKSLELDPGQVESNYSLGMILGDIGNPLEALNYFDQAIGHAEGYKGIDPVDLREMLAVMLFARLHTKQSEVLPSNDAVPVSDYVRKKLDAVLKKKLAVDPSDHKSFYPFAEAFMGRQAGSIPKRERVTAGTSGGSNKKKKKRKKRK